MAKVKKNLLTQKGQHYEKNQDYHHEQTHPADIHQANRENDLRGER
jgi:hypothetical protein